MKVNKFQDPTQNVGTENHNEFQFIGVNGTTELSIVERNHQLLLIVKVWHRYTHKNDLNNDDHVRTVLNMKYSIYIIGLKTP